MKVSPGDKFNMAGNWNFPNNEWESLMSQVDLVSNGALQSLGYWANPRQWNV